MSLDTLQDIYDLADFAGIESIKLRAMVGAIENVFRVSREVAERYFTTGEGPIGLTVIPQDPQEFRRVILGFNNLSQEEQRAIEEQVREDQRMYYAYYKTNDPATLIELVRQPFFLSDTEKNLSIYQEAVVGQEFEIPGLKYMFPTFSQYLPYAAQITIAVQQHGQLMEENKEYLAIDIQYPDKVRVIPRVTQGTSKAFRISRFYELTNEVGPTNVIEQAELYYIFRSNTQFYLPQPIRDPQREWVRYSTPETWDLPRNTTVTKYNPAGEPGELSIGIQRVLYNTVIRVGPYGFTTLNADVQRVIDIFLNYPLIAQLTFMQADQDEISPDNTVSNHPCFFYLPHMHRVSQNPMTRFLEGGQCPILDVYDNNAEEEYFCVRRALEKHGIVSDLPEMATVEQLRQVCIENNVALTAYDVTQNIIAQTEGARPMKVYVYGGHLYCIDDRDIERLLLGHTELPATLKSSTAYKLCRTCNKKYKGKKVDHDQWHKETDNKTVAQLLEQKAQRAILNCSAIECARQFLAMNIIPRIDYSKQYVEYAGLRIACTDKNNEYIKHAERVGLHAQSPACIAQSLLEGIKYKSTLSDECAEQFNRECPTALNWVSDNINFMAKYPSIDIRRCYARAACNMLPVFNHTDNITVYKEEDMNIKHAFFYCEGFKFHDKIDFPPGWYIGYIVQYFGLTPLYSMIPSSSCTLKPVVECINRLDLPKDIINHMIGKFRRTADHIKSRVCITADPSDELLMRNRGARCIFIEGQYKGWQFEYRRPTDFYATPIYYAIVQLAYVYVAQLIRQANVDIVAIKTDAIYYSDAVKPEILLEDYRHQPEAFIKRGRELRPSFGTRPIVRDWNIYHITHDELQHKSCFITGLPGTGKSYIMRQLITDNSICLSFQNNVARNIGPQGRTFHRFFCMQEDNFIRCCPLNKFSTVDRIIIDEWQLTPVHIINLLCSIKKCYPHIQFLLFGDYNQFLAIDRDNIEYSTSKEIAALHDFNILHLTENKRIKSAEYVECLERRDFHAAQQMCCGPYGRYTICYYNKTVKRINDEWLNKKLDYIALVCKQSHGDFVKGCHYIATEAGITLDTAFHEQGPMHATYDMKYFDYGWAFTAHKTIGLTIQVPHNIYIEQNPDYERFLLVALSRCTSPANVCIIRP